MCMMYVMVFVGIAVDLLLREKQLKQKTDNKAIQDTFGDLVK